MSVHAKNGASAANIERTNVQNVKHQTKAIWHTMHSVNEIHSAHNCIHCILAYYILTEGKMEADPTTLL